MYKNQFPYIKSSLLSTPHYKITVATTTHHLPPLNSPSHNEALLLNPTPTFSYAMFAPVRLMLNFGSWLRTRRSRCFLLLLCSPLLIPFICATFPLLCLADICVRIFRQRRSGKSAAAQDEEAEAEQLRRCEEGCCCGGEGGLLQRYLEDQLALVGSVYECGDDEFDDQAGDRDLDLDCKVPLLS